MEKIVKIVTGGVELEAILNTSKTADAIWKALPITAQANTWGEEIYFSIPVKMELEQGQEVVGLGDLGYWPPGSAFCIFFGLTPMSRNNEIRPASAVTVFARVTGNPAILKRIKPGMQIAIERKTA
jgi:hypothetical protein